MASRNLELVRALAGLFSSQRHYTRCLDGLLDEAAPTLRFFLTPTLREMPLHVAPTCPRPLGGPPFDAGSAFTSTSYGSLGVLGAQPAGATPSRSTNSAPRVFRAELGLGGAGLAI